MVDGGETICAFFVVYIWDGFGFGGGERERLGAMGGEYVVVSGALSEEIFLEAHSIFLY